ncbi:response regulator [Neurospora crassa OR74A]|uniref:Response regulator n=1 Tax=Neurospora crassa (strain ATCC 24698 / 74-OR23-1A / CBS 708.71 / DSM 1257 / FGSC 987) TaxID=367110 RepID=V5IP58_NEUCR|nr:response regulator [Neurospora crassa OR74A]ESA43867.1 response regulator [Neurospora crassa OR74A]|eukprot:XP_011392892.1 response regulator [Neurospora crassa OR74A]
MVDLKSKLRARLSRRNSGISLLTSSKSYSGTGNHGSIHSPNDDARSDKNLDLESVRPTSSVSADAITDAGGRGGREQKRVGGGEEAAGGAGTGAGAGAANAAPGEHKEKASGFLALLIGASHSARTGSRQATFPKHAAQSIRSVDDARQTSETPGAITGQPGEDGRLKQYGSNTDDINGDCLSTGGSGDKDENADLQLVPPAVADPAGAGAGSGHVGNSSSARAGTDNYTSKCDTGSPNSKSAQQHGVNAAPAAAGGAATNATSAKSASGQPPASSVTNRAAPGAGSDWTPASDLRRVSISSARVSSLASIHEDDDLAHTAAGDEPLPPPTTSTLATTIDAAATLDATTPTNPNPNPFENSHHRQLADAAAQSATPTTAAPDIVRRVRLIDSAVNSSSSQPPTPAPLATSAAASPSIVSFNSVAPLSPTGTVPLSPSAETPSIAPLPFSTSTPANLNLNPPSTDPTATPGSPTTTALSTSTALTRPSVPPRRQSLLPSRQTTLIRTLLDANQTDELDTGANTNDHLLPISATMVIRKIWVKRPGGSATLVTINEEDLVDDVRDLILRKYANSLGRQFDSPDLILRIAPRESQRQERVLGPEEPMARTLDAYFPGGQTVDEALVIDIPPRRTPKESPRTGPPHVPHGLPTYYEETHRPSEGGTDYFGPGALAHLAPGIGGGPVMTAPVNGPPQSHPHTMSNLGPGHIPQLPSPGGTRPRQYRERPDRPRLGRQHTSSPTILNVVGAGGHAATIAVSSANHGMQQSSVSKVQRSRTHSIASSEQSTTGAVPGPPASAPHAPHVPSAPPLPTPPPAAQEPVPAIPTQHPVTTPPARVASPRPPTAMATRTKKKKATPDHTPLPAVMLSSAVPPINVLIVEDNIINLKLLEAFVKRLKVRWQTAMNGREAVNKWRKGGFHLVLMDIQLPIMSGLEATREIRRLERMNSIGVFSNSNSNGGTNGGESGGDPDVMPEEDKLENIELFKSPVIIVALTASSLQSDRHEALAAGCNDFLTKPITYIWLERKVMEWGCMQALIDFDGWRKWKDFGSSNGEDKKDNASAVKDSSGMASKKAVTRPKRKPTMQKEVTSPHHPAQAAPPSEVSHTTQTSQTSSDDK